MTTSAVDEVVIRPRSDRTRSAREDKSRLVQRLVLGACVGLFAGLGLYEAWADGPTFDEPVYVAAGLQAVLHHDLAINAEHPPLPKVLSVLPVLFVGPVVPHDSTPNTNDEWSYSAKFVQAQEQAGTLRAVTFASRLMALLESIAIAAVLFSLGRRLFGRTAGTVAASLWLLSPFVLGIGHINAIDPAFTLTVVGWAWVMLRWTYRPTLSSAVLVGLVSAAAILSDVTGLLIAALGVVVMLVYGRSRLPRWGLQQVLVTGAVAWAATWAFYALLDPAVLLHPTVLLPSPYFQGIRYLSVHDTKAGPGYLLGVAWTGGRWWYWPGAMLVKTVPTTLLLLLVGPIGWWTVDRPTRRRLLAVVVAPALLLTAFNLNTPRDIGLRYMFPVIALWLVAASSVVRCGRLGSVLAVATMAVAAVFTVGSAPGSLAWAAPPFAPAYRSVTNADGTGVRASTSCRVGAPASTPGCGTSVQGGLGPPRFRERARSSAPLRVASPVGWRCQPPI